MALSKDINLLAGKKEVSAEKARTIRLVKTGSFVLLVGYSLVALAIFSFWFYLQKEGQRVEQQINLKKRQIKELEKIESLQLILKGRLSTLGQILNRKEPNYSLFLGYFEQFLSQGIGLTSLNLSDEGKVVFSGLAENASDLASFLEKIGEEKTLFSRVVLTTVVRNEEGQYSFDLEAEGNK